MTYENFTLPQSFWDELTISIRSTYIKKYYKEKGVYPSQEEIKLVSLTEEEIENYKRKSYANYIAKLSLNKSSVDEDEEESIMPPSVDDMPLPDNVEKITTEWITFSQTQGNLPTTVTVTLEENNGYDRYFVLSIDAKYTVLGDNGGQICSFACLQKGKLGPIHIGIPDFNDIPNEGYTKAGVVKTEKQIFESNNTQFTVYLDNFNPEGTNWEDKGLLPIESGEFSISCFNAYTVKN